MSAAEKPKKASAAAIPENGERISKHRVVRGKLKQRFEAAPDAVQPDMAAEKATVEKPTHISRMLAGHFFGMLHVDRYKTTKKLAIIIPMAVSFLPGVYLYSRDTVSQERSCQMARNKTAR